MRLPLRVDRRIFFVEGEDAAAALDAESEDDVLALTPALDLPELIEDELLLALPLVPRHEVCPEPLPRAFVEDDPATTPADHPFAALAALKQRVRGPTERGGIASGRHCYNVGLFRDRPPCRTRSRRSPASAPLRGLQENSMAVQQNKKSPSKRGMHRSHNALDKPGIAIEPTTGETHLRHHISPTGFYRGRKVLKTKADA